jgi:uncharacterized membrane protein
MAHPRWVRSLFSERDLADIAAAVARVEASAAAEVRVHLERRLPRPLGKPAPDPLPRALALFQQLGMHRTRRRNGVLLYLALDDHKLAIVGDEAVHTRVGPAYWERVRDLMVEHLRAREPREAVVQAVEEVGRVLAEHFPRSPGGDGGELSNEVSVE